MFINKNSNVKFSAIRISGTATVFLSCDGVFNNIYFRLRGYKGHSTPVGVCLIKYFTK